MRSAVSKATSINQDSDALVPLLRASGVLACDVRVLLSCSWLLSVYTVHSGEHYEPLYRSSHDFDGAIEEGKQNRAVLTR